MDIRQPPSIGSVAQVEEIGKWAEELYGWAYDLYDWLKFPHFHQLGLVGHVTYTADRTLTEADLCRLVKINSASKVTVTLLAATTARIGYFV